MVAQALGAWLAFVVLQTQQALKTQLCSLDLSIKLPRGKKIHVGTTSFSFLLFPKYI